MAASADADDLDSWTVIKAKKRSNRRGPRSGLDFHQSAPPQPKASGPATPIAVAHIRSEYERIMIQVQEQHLYRPIKDWVIAAAPSHAPISRAICLGAGSFGGPLNGGEAIRRAYVQTCVFLAMVDILSQHFHATISCFFQEPLYNAADRSFLESLGHSVVETPMATSLITKDTFVYAIHLPAREYIACVANNQPAMLVGTAYDCYENLPQYFSTEASSLLANLRQVHCTFSHFAFPHDKHDLCFSDTCIYWRATDKTEVARACPIAQKHVQTDLL